MFHDLRRRIETGGPSWAPGPADADHALEVVARLRREVQELIEDAPVRAAAHQAVVERTIDEASMAVPPAGASRRRKPLAIALVVFTLLAALFTILLSRDSAMERGVAAFRDDDMTEAVRHFRAAVEDDPEDATARLYLGRVYRRLDRHAEAGDQLREAATLAPRDPDVRRELGYLFLDLRSFDASVRQFEQAVELEPDEEANWIGLVRAMRRSGDPRAESTLARAPAAARALLARDAQPSPEPLE